MLYKVFMAENCLRKFYILCFLPYNMEEESKEDLFDDYDDAETDNDFLSEFFEDG